MSTLSEIAESLLQFLEELRAQGRALVEREGRMIRERDDARSEADHLRTETAQLRARLDAAEEELQSMRSRRAVRLSDGLARVARRRRD